MKNFNLLLTFLLLVSCQFNENQCLRIDSRCTNGTMKEAWYEYGLDTVVTREIEFNEGFQIVVDTMRKPIDFISFTENYAREQNADLKTEFLYLGEDEEQLSDKEKKERYEEIRINYGLEADSIHQKNNEKDLLVWIVNNSNDTVELQMQDWSFICVKEAKNGCGEWKSVEYWEFSFCGNSYYYQPIFPRVIKQFAANRFEGDIEAELRFKLLGKEKLYYSNSFWGTIEECAFQIDTIEDRQKYMLEKPLKLVIIE